MTERDRENIKVFKSCFLTEIRSFQEYCGHPYSDTGFQHWRQMLDTDMRIIETILKMEMMDSGPVGKEVEK